MSDDVAELVERTRAGDTAAADRLVRLHLGAAYAVALSVTRSPHDAEDVAQDALIQALERIAECRDPARFGGWLLRIVRNRAFNHRRYLGVRAASALDEAVATPSADSPHDDAERSELRERLTRAAGELGETQREVLLLHDLEGWKHREIGAALGMPEGTVRYHLFNARKAMRALLRAARGGDEEP
jgi:RNA polymerase sigma-70 factor, ECF subfamily